jgi:DNA-binding PadR family transcriptional regulator
MAAISPQTIYDNLSLLEQEDVVNSARYRQLAQDVLANPEVSLSWRQAISERLNQANRLLAMLTVGKDDSY